VPADYPSKRKGLAERDRGFYVLERQAEKCKVKKEVIK